MDSAKSSISRRDARADRVKAFQNGVDTAKLMLGRFGNDQIHLRNIGTHPRYQRRGYATVLCRWGMHLASQEGLVVSLFAGPLGFKLYSGLGFASLGKIRVQIPGEEESVNICPMVYDPREEQTVRAYE